jgi:hypothetical protein
MLPDGVLHSPPFRNKAKGLRFAPHPDVRAVTWIWTAHIKLIPERLHIQPSNLAARITFEHPETAMKFCLSPDNALTMLDVSV